MSAPIASTPSKRKREDSISSTKDVKLPPARIARLGDAAAKKRVSTVRDTLRTPLGNKTNMIEESSNGLGKVNLKTPLQSKMRDTGKTPQTQARIAKIPGAAGAGVAQSAVAGRAKPLDRLRPGPPKLSLPAQTPQGINKISIIENKENLPVPSGSLSSLIEQAGFEERAKTLEDEFARKNKEAEDAWNLKAEELQKQMEAAKQDQEAAMKAQFDMAALLSSQREKYEDTINKLCHELGETRVKLQLSEEQRQAHEQQQVAAPDVQPEAPQLPPPSSDELSQEAARQIREKCEAEFLQSLQLLEADWNAVQVDMERRLEEVEQQELSARCAQEEAASLLSAQQEKHDAETARLQEELAQALASLRQMEEQERANRAQTQSNFEDQMREMQVEYEKRTSEREAEWSAKFDRLREQMEIEGQECLEEQARSHATTLQEKEALWTGKVETLQQELELAKQAEQEAFTAQREIATLLDQGQQKHELELAQLSAKCEALRQELEAAQQARQSEAETKHELLVNELREALAAEREERRKEAERARLVEADVGRCLTRLSDELAKKRELRVQERERFPRTFGDKSM